MNTQENNKLIAEFLGVYQDDKGYWGFTNTKEHQRWHTDRFLDATHYDTDWNWLMDVVSKIESIVWEDLNDTSFNVTIGATSYCVIQDNNGGVIEIIGQGSTKIESVYKACVEFIKWYNEQK